MAYRNTMAASSFIEQNKNLKDSFQKSVERPAVRWLAGTLAFVVAWVATGLLPSVPIHVHTTVCAGMLGWFITNIAILAFALVMKRRSALLELSRYHSNRFMHRMFELAEERTAGCTTNPEKHVTGIAQVDGGPLVVRQYTFDAVIWRTITKLYFLCNGDVSTWSFRPNNATVDELMELADMLAATNNNTTTITASDQQHDEKNADVSGD